jgi:diketogulonate reductase-like aldo/keto reductase
MQNPIIPFVKLSDGTQIPALGQGTWHMGESSVQEAAEISALRAGIDLGLTLIDTAEMYAGGGAERVVAQAIKGQRDKVFVVSKVSPQNASASGIEKSSAASLRRLATDVIDLYLLHWPGRYPIGETVAAFETLREAGRIRYWGVSNFDTTEMKAVAGLPAGGQCAANQVLYHPEARGIEYDLLPWCRARKMPIMAYSPLGQAGRLLRSKALAAIGRRHGASPAQIALAWSIRDGNTISIPKALSPRHMDENARAASIELTEADLAEIDATHPPPREKEALGML